jgi:hypothetical protein
MASELLVRDLEPRTMAWLEERARQSGRPVDLEAKRLLEQAARPGSSDTRALAARMRRRLAGRSHCDSAELLRADRDR